MASKTRAEAIATALVVVAALAGAAAAGPLDDPGFAKSLTCSACHGAGGNSRSDAMPIIAGMDAGYFKKQIEAYATGRRPSPEMEPFAKMVQVLGVDDVARHFAAQPRLPTAVPVDAAAVTRGRAAAGQCAICHGAEGKGDPARMIPSLAGQPPGYLREQMLLFKQDRRSPGDAMLRAMKTLMQSIPDETYADLAAFYSSVR